MYVKTNKLKGYEKPDPLHFLSSIYKYKQYSVI